MKQALDEFNKSNSKNKIDKKLKNNYIKDLDECAIDLNKIKVPPTQSTSTL